MQDTRLLAHYHKRYLGGVRDIWHVSEFCIIHAPILAKQPPPAELFDDEFITTTATDVYAMAMTMLELGTGRYPFQVGYFLIARLTIDGDRLPRRFQMGSMSGELLEKDKGPSLDI